MVAPVIYQNPLLFKEITSADQIVQPENYVNTVRSTKEFMFPISEPVIEFSYKNKELQLDDYEPVVTPYVIIGLRPCDAAAFNVIDDIFNYEYKDEFYIKRRENTILIGAACENADENCISTHIEVF